MPGTFWMSAGATAAAAMVMGLGLGGYATSPQGRSPADVPAEANWSDDSAPLLADDAALRGPVAITCTGCGPTLADRQWHADMAGWDRSGMTGESSDSVVRDYLDDAPIEEVLPPEPPRIVEQLPPNVVRFASSNVAARPVSIEPVAAPPAAAPDMPTPPPQVAATAPEIRP
jgi:hypothetical protein